MIRENRVEKKTELDEGLMAPCGRCGLKPSAAIWDARPLLLVERGGLRYWVCGYCHESGEEILRVERAMRVLDELHRPLLHDPRTGETFTTRGGRVE